MTETEILSLAKYLASSRSEFTLSEMNLYLNEKSEEKYIRNILKPHFFDLDIFCDSLYNCTKVTKKPLPADGSVIAELESLFKNPGLPPRIEKLIESYIEVTCGKNWDKGRTADLIRENIVGQKDEYWKAQGDFKYTKVRIVSYLLYHFPVYFCQFQYLMLELLKNGMLSNKMSFVDAGSGPGTITLSIIDFLMKLLDIYSKKNIDVKLNIKIDSIEPAQENIECYDELTSGYLSRFPPGKFNITINEPVHTTIEEAKLPKDADLIIFSNVLAEMTGSPAGRGEIVEKMASGSRNPSIIIIEPADLDNSKALRVTQHALVKKGYNVYGPCTFIWGTGCNGENCWSFAQPGNIRVPGFMKKIADTGESYRYINTDMKFSYVIMRKDDLVKNIYRAKGKFMRLSNIRKHIEKRVNVAASVMSGNLGDKRTLVFKICDGTTSLPCYAVLPIYHMNEGNDALIEAGYGDIVEIFGTLIRENKTLSSFNLLITRNTMVTKVS